MSPKASLRRPAFTYPAERRRIQHKQQAFGISQHAGSEMTGLLPKRLDGDHLLSKTVMIENLSMRMALKSEGRLCLPKRR